MMEDKILICHRIVVAFVNISKCLLWLQPSNRSGISLIQYWDGVRNGGGGGGGGSWEDLQEDRQRGNFVARLTSLRTFVPIWYSILFVRLRDSHVLSLAIVEGISMGDVCIFYFLLFELRSISLVSGGEIYVLNTACIVTY